MKAITERAHNGGKITIPSLFSLYPLYNDFESILLNQAGIYEHQTSQCEWLTIYIRKQYPTDSSYPTSLLLRNPIKTHHAVATALRRSTALAVADWVFLASALAFFSAVFRSRLAARR